MNQNKIEYFYLCKMTKLAHFKAYYRIYATHKHKYLNTRELPGIALVKILKR